MTILILGSGKSAIAAQNYLLLKKEKVRLYDDQHHPCSLQEVEALCIKQAIISPGFLPTHWIVRYLEKKAIPIISEMELGLQNLKTKAIAVTGTNGKTTVSFLIEHILNQYQIKAKAIGNIGIPICEYLLGPCDEEVLIIEMSSYQLERVGSKNLDYGLILNIYPHHLDRYQDFQDYAKAKRNLLKIVKKTTYISDQVLQVFPDLINSCSLIEPMQPVSASVFQENLESAFAICKLFHLSEREFFQALQTFTRPKHRLEWVANILGIDFYNDSKATNVNAVIRAIESFDKSIILIAGGYDCKGDFSPWKKTLSPKVRKIMAFGETSKKMKDQLENYLDIEIVKDLNEALQKSVSATNPGEIVLFSPGCPSFGEYVNYEQRGEAFKQCVKALEERRS